MTIYEKEALFDEIDETFSKLKQFVCDAIDKSELHEAERGEASSSSSSSSSSPESVPSARRGRGEKPGIKKDAVVVCDFSFDPEARKPQELVKGLLNQFTQPEKDQAKKERQTRKAQGKGQPRAPVNNHVFATLDGKDAAFDHLMRHLKKRDPSNQKPIIALLDGEPALEHRLIEQLEAHNLTHRLDAVILDIIHASEYLWDVATCLYGERDDKRTDWVEDKLYMLTHNKVGYLIGALRQRMTKNADTLSTTQKKVLKKTITYFDNHLLYAI